jgi:hypothetical protein
VEAALIKKMQRDTSDAFGKLEQDDDGAVTRWHPLVDHLIDVAVCFDFLCRCQSIRRALEGTAQRKLHPGDIARLAVLVFLHDLGKANSGFQAKRWVRKRFPLNGRCMRAMELKPRSYSVTMLPLW